MRNRLWFAGIAVISMVLWYGCQPRNPYRNTEVTADEIRHHIEYLASDDLEGRRAGSPGSRKAGGYIAREFKTYGLKKPGDQVSYFQWFDFVAGVSPGRDNGLTVNGEALVYDVDFRPVHFSSTDTVEAGVIFCGYGITLPEENYDDYREADVTGKIAMIMRYNPDGLDGKSPFVSKSDLRYKATNARENGAAGVIFVTGPEDDDEDLLLKFGRDRNASGVGIPVISVTRQAADTILKPAGISLTELQPVINKERTGYSQDLDSVSVRMETDIVIEGSRTRNIAGYLPGNDEVLRDELVVIGAHYDHLGWGGAGSMTPDSVVIHNGADDNASGVAGVLEIAQYLAAKRDSLKRSYLFIAFGAEEAGLLGSTHYVRHPLFPLENTITMINMDMIGRMKDSTVIISGAGTAPEWKPLLNELSEDHLQLRFQEEGYGPSDHSPYYGSDIPVLFFFTGVHEDYHKYSDDPGTINSDGEAMLVSFVASVAEHLGKAGQKPQFTKVEESKPSMGRTDLNVYTGTVPDFAHQGKGYGIQGVNAGSPADKAGLEPGDIILEFGGVTVNSIYDYMYALQQYLPGDAVRLTISRDGKTMEKIVILARKR